jgi:O-methyltransferase involved in polyketide biosynthesis
MADRVKAELGAVQETLFIPLAARARETRRRRPILRDPKAAEILASVDFATQKYGRSWGGGVTVLRTAIFDCWVSDFLAEHPGGTVVEIGTGLNTRFERVGNGQAHWIDLDLPDTIDLRRRFLTDSQGSSHAALPWREPCGCRRCNQGTCARLSKESHRRRGGGSPVP